MSVIPFKQVKVGRLIQLPNNDLWRGRQDDVVERADTFEADVPVGVEDAALDAFQHQKGETVACTWCGMGFTRKQFNEFTAHIEKEHSRALNPLAAVEAKEAFDLSQSEIVARVEIDEPVF